MMDDCTGQLFGNYRLIRHIGKGSFADVYLGEHVNDIRQAAVKLLHIKPTEIGNFKSFINEASTTIHLTHPNIVQLLHFGIGEKDIPFLAMSYAPNGTLRSRHPKKTRLPLATIVAYVKQIAAALQFAHDQKLVHRDVKQENILLGVEDELLLSDFGIAAIAHNSRSLNIQDSAGTIPYMAPEQLQGKPCPASDQYAVGIMVYEWLCGELPFQGTFHEIGSQHMFATPASLVEKVPGLSKAVEQIVMKALEKDPKKRFLTILAFADALEKQYIAELLPLSGITFDFLLLELRKSTSLEDEATEQTLTGPGKFRADLTQTEVEHLIRKAIKEIPKEHWPQLIDLTDALKRAAQAEIIEANQTPGISPLSNRVHFEQHIEINPILEMSSPSNVAQFEGTVHFEQQDLLAGPRPFGSREFVEIIRQAIKKVPKEDLPQLISLADVLKQVILAIVSDASKTVTMFPPSHEFDVEQDLDILSLLKTRIIGKLNSHEEGFVEQAPVPNNIEGALPQPQVLSPEPTIDRSEHTVNQTKTPEDSPSTLLFPSSVAQEDELKNFFILYHRANYDWAEWITWYLQQEKYSVILPPWPLHRASNFKIELQKAAAKAKQTLLILSPDSLKVLNVQPAYITLLKRKSADEEKRMLLMYVRECGDQYRSLLDLLHYIDLTGVNEARARAILLASITGGSIEVIDRPPFPGNTNDRIIPDAQKPPPFPAVSTQSIEIFFAYSHKDKDARDELELHLAHLKSPFGSRAWQIRAWHDGEIGAGDNYAREILYHLNNAHIILLIISQDFIASHYCYHNEMQEALKRHDNGQARVIPIIVREASWEDTPIKNLQILPAGAKPINSRKRRERREKALKDVVQGIEKEIEKFLYTR